MKQRQKELEEMIEEKICCGWCCLSKDNNEFIGGVIEMLFEDLSLVEYHKLKNRGEIFLINNYPYFSKGQELYFYDSKNCTEEEVKEELGLL